MDRIRQHFPERHFTASLRGRTPMPARWILDAMLCILNTDAQWHMFPQRYPNDKTVHRRFQQGCRIEVLRGMLIDLAKTL